jgi:AcrR family transcriptional regulator
MALEADAGAAPRPPLSRERVVQAAIDLADAGGIGSLTMRRLAQELGVEAMTLYYYVANKDDIHQAMVEFVEAQVELPEPGADWKAAIRRTAISAHEILTRHPWAAALTLGLHRPSPPRLEYMNAILRTFREAGFSEDLTDHAYHTIEAHIMGFTLWEVGMNLGTPDDLRSLAATFLASLPVEEYPHVAEHVAWHLEPPRPDDEGAFAFGLDLLLDGLDRKRAATTGRQTGSTRRRRASRAS